MVIDRRNNARPECLDLLDYLVIDEQGRQGEYSMGRSLNISKGGILMETHTKLPNGQQVMITLGLKNQLIEVMGKIVYIFGESGRYHYGIEFSHIAESNRRIFTEYVNAFHKEQQAANPMPPDALQSKKSIGTNKHG